jgi:acylphosphatase
MEIHFTNMERMHLRISGYVQGVFFRMHTQQTAISMGLVGWVRNSEDGGVEVMAEGEPEKLQKLLAWCRKGPPSAHVSNVAEEWGPASGDFTQFSIRY